MRLYGNGNVQVTRRATVKARFALAAHVKRLAVVDARRDVDHDFFRAVHPALAAAFGAWLLDDFSRAAARIARARGNKRAKHGVLLYAHLTAAATGRAFDRLSSGLCACPLARGAGFLTRDIDFLADAERGLLKGNGKVITQIVACDGAVSCLCSAAEAAKAAEHGINDIRKVPKARAAVIRTARAASGGRIERCMTKLVVLIALFLIGKHLVRLVDFLKFLLGLFIAGVMIRMVLQSRFAKSGLDLVRGRIPVDAQRFVVVCFRQFPKAPF